MSRLFTLAAAGAFAFCVGATAWSQNAQSGAAAGASGGAGASGAGAAAGQAGAANAGVAGQAGTAQTPNPNNVPGQQQFNSPSARNGFDQFGTFGGPIRNPFFMDPSARQQLNMNDQQFNQLNQSHQQALQAFNQSAQQLRANQNLTPQQRAAQLQQLQAQFNQQFGQTVDTTFTDPRLRNRFNQLNWQFRPFAAFNDATVSRQLQLAPEQQRELRRLGSQWREQMQRLRRAGRNAASDPQAANEQFAAMQLQFQQQMQQIMTPQQWQMWSQITGEPFNFSRSAFFPQGNNVRVAQQPRFGDERQDGNVGATRGTPLDSQGRPAGGSPNGAQNGNQNNNNAARNGNVGATQGTPADSQSPQ
jgi:hypothetical protein